LNIQTQQSCQLRNDLSTDLRFEILAGEIDKLNQCLVSVVSQLDEDRSVVEKDFLGRMSRWEYAFYSRRIEPIDYRVDSTEVKISKEDLQSYLQMKFPEWTGLEVTAFKALEGGLSKTTILFETDDAVNGKQSMVIRADQSIKFNYSDGFYVDKEYYLLKVMFQKGLPVPEPLWLEEDNKKLGLRFLVSRKSDGEGFESAWMGVDEQLPEDLLESVMSTMVAILSVTIDESDVLAQQSHLKPWLPYKTVRDVVTHYVNTELPEFIRRAAVKQTPSLVRVSRIQMSHLL
jgi:hypothetical protein